MGNNPRFVVTNLELPAVELYDELYCKRGEAENGSYSSCGNLYSFTNPS